MSENKKVWKFAPCRDYDIDGVETWLSDMAEEGLLLSADGFMLGCGIFEKVAPCKAKYRLEAATGSTSMFSDNSGMPDDEALELSKKYEWEFVANYGSFHIYRTFSDTAREMNTDPVVQAIALRRVKKKKLTAVTILLLEIALIVFLSVYTGAGVMVMITGLGTARFLLAAAIVLMGTVEAVVAVVRLSKMEKTLADGEIPRQQKSWRKKRAAHLVMNGIFDAMVLAFAVLTLINWNNKTLHKYRVPLKDYTGTVPFATLSDFVTGDIVSYKETMTGLSYGFNTIEEKNDLICRKRIQYGEYAIIKTADGKTLDGGYNVDYMELINESAAKLLFRELCRAEAHEKNFKQMDTPDLNADEAMAFYNLVHFPNIMLRKGNIVVTVYLNQSGGHEEIPADEWMGILADSIG